MYGTGINAPQGLKPSAYSLGATWNRGTLSNYTIISGYSTGTGAGLFQQDPATPLSTGGVGIGTTSGAWCGVFKGFQWVKNGFFFEQSYWPAATAPDTNFNGGNGVALVYGDPNILWDIQVASDAGGTVAAPTAITGDINNNFGANFAVTSYNAISGVTPAANPGAGNTRTGLSGWYLAYNTLSTTATLPLKSMYFTPVNGNVSGVVFNNLICSINNHTAKGGTGTLGV